MASAPCSGRIAARYCLVRITTMPMPTRCSASIAAASSAVGLLGGLVGRHEPVGLLVVDRVDRRQVDEVGDLDGSRRAGPQRSDLLGVEGHVAAGLDLVAEGDVALVDLLTGEPWTTLS